MRAADVAETIELDEAADLDDTADPKDEPTRATDVANIPRTADDATPPQDADHLSVDREARPTLENAPASTALDAESATADVADADPGKHLAAIEAALTLAEKMRAHELAAQRPGRRAAPLVRRAALLVGARGGR